MTGIRGSHKRAALPALRPFSIEKPMYTICSMFAICSFAKTGTGLFFDPWWPVLKMGVACFGLPALARSRILRWLLASDKGVCQ
jgi:hypothetical protein